MKEMQKGYNHLYFHLVQAASSANDMHIGAW